jgi:hypothetical protein
MDRRAALIAFNTIEQRKGETLPDYRLRLQQCVEVLEAIQHPHIPSAEEQVLQFIVGMRGKYSAYSQHIQNDMIEGVDTPTTIAEAEHDAEHWRQEVSSANTSSNHGDTPKGAYNTTGKVKNGKKTKKTGKPKTPASSDDASTASQGKSSKAKTESKDNNCILCGEADHWAKQCPLRGKVNQLIKEGKIVAVTINTGVFSEDTLTLAAKADGP